MKNDFKINFFSKIISEDEFEKIKENYYLDIKKLYDIMPNLTHEEYRKRFSEISNDLNSSQHLYFPNTAWIENREFEVFGKHWYDDIFVLK